MCIDQMLDLLLIKIKTEKDIFVCQKGVGAHLKHKSPNHVSNHGVVTIFHNHQLLHSYVYCTSLIPQIKLI